MKKISFLIALAFLTYIYIFAQNSSKLVSDKFNHQIFSLIIGDCFVDNQSYSFLQDICDYAGGRIAGSEQNKKAIAILRGRLKKLNINSRIQKFPMLTFVRGNDVAEIISPIYRQLRAITLGFNDSTSINELVAVFANYGREDDYKNIDARGKAVFVFQEFGYSIDKLTRYEQIKIAHKYGASAIFIINDKPGFQLLAGVSNFNQEKSLIPSFSVSYEEGIWIKRLLEKKENVKIRFKINSHIKKTESENVIVRLQGSSNYKIVIGAHFDSWDLGQGAIDNGLGSAILFDVCKTISKYSPKNYYTIEFVWFNAEELGIVGASYYANNSSDSVLLMINLDMPGVPTGINIMGFDHLLEYAQFYIKLANGFSLNENIISAPWTNSDHFPFIENGIPALTFTGKLDEKAVKHYHDYGDTFDKADKFQMSCASATIASFLYYISNSNLKYFKLSKSQVIEFLKKHNLDIMLRKQNVWKF